MCTSATILSSWEENKSTNMGSDNRQDNLTAAYIDHSLVIRIEGRGSFKISPPLKQFIHRTVETKSATRILIDMSLCKSMDSTFMGVLAGLSYQMSNKPKCTLKLIHLSEKNEKLLRTLGVDRVVNYSRDLTREEIELLERLSPDAQTLEAGATDPLDAAKTSLEAHENLVHLNPANFDKFKSVLELLQKDVENLDND
jgi:anti-sigma B factor antagonist